MVALEALSDVSRLFDFFLLIISVAVAGFAIKVKFIAAAERKALEVDKKADKLRTDHDALKDEFYKYRLDHAERHFRNSN